MAKSKSPASTPLAKSSPAEPHPENIFLFIPNLIGYARVVLAGASLYYMSYHPHYCTILYSISCLLDALDGYAARKYNQSTKFGAVLDMVTDRCTTSCLLCFLSSAYPKWAILFQSLISLDLASHYMHMYASLDRGSGSHKKVEKKRSRILNLYYSNNKVLFIFCAANEVFFLAMYLLSFPEFAAVHSWPWVVATVTFPICAAKQIVNVVQLVKAAVSLAEGDLEARRKD
ncbi:phosphatidylinositol synthase 1 (CDP-alcohol phosphatidyltransferase1) [Maublancomyces gigas]|uniref:CDP-diacylglycerol--inositol 3-phosphatidyltransferase n=1 Tax=Discina gigas TaxID=1032678 RepID=A0ABR3GH14_9PEZI